MTKYRALLLDFDGVLRLWPKDDSEMERNHGLPAGAVRNAAFEPALLHRAISGQISDAAWRSEVGNLLQRMHPDSYAQGAIEAWSVTTGTVDEKVLSIVRRARRRVRVALVTNATSRLPSDLEVLGLVNDFDAIVNSSVVGAIKPHEAFYRAALQSVGVKPEEALFVDDSRVNVRAALQFGLHAVHYESDARLRQFLRANRILDQESKF